MSTNPALRDHQPAGLPAQTELPDLTQYLMVHRAIRNATRRLAVVAPELATSDRDRIIATRRYWTGLAGEILIHHRLEDDVFFPALDERSPRMAELTGRLADDHELLDEIMDAVAIAIADLDRAGAASRLAHVLGHLADHMEEHLDLEDVEVLPLFQACFSVAEYEALEQRALKSVPLGKQAAFTVPFIVDSVDLPERADLLAGAPAPMRLVYRAARRRHARLASAVFGSSVRVVRVEEVVR